jgi:hypothetical protein
MAFELRNVATTTFQPPLPNEAPILLTVLAQLPVHEQFLRSHCSYSMTNRTKNFAGQAVRLVFGSPSHRVA